MTPGNNPKVWKLTASAILAVCAGGYFLVKMLQGSQGPELLEFTTIYIIAPLGLSLILLFSYLQRR